MMRTLVGKTLLGLWGTRAGGSAAPAFDYYIDSVAGSDSNDGTSEAAPWQTIGKLTTEAVLANDVRIGLKRGGSWREMLNVATLTGVEVGWYGSLSDPMPVISCADLASEGNWALTGGRTAAYDRSWTHSVTAGNFIQVWNPDGTLPTWVSSAATCESTPNSFFVSSTIANPATVYYHPPGSTAPQAGVEITARDYAVWGNSADTVITGIHGTKNGNNNGSLLGYSLVYCLMSHGTKHNGFSYNVSKSVFYKASNPSGRWNSATMWVGYHETDGADLVVADSYAVGSGFAGVTGFYSHTPGGGVTSASVTYERLYGYNIDATANTQDCDATTIRDCFFERHGIPFASATNPTNATLNIDNVTLIATSADGASPANPTRIINGFASAGSVTVRDFRWRSSGIATSGGWFSTVPIGATVDIQESTFVAEGSGFSVLMNSSAAGTVAVTFLNNITNGVDKLWEFTNAAGMITLSDYNVVGPTALENKLENTNRANWATYIAAYPAFDANSSLSAPGFTGTPANGDFAFTAGGTPDTGGRTAGSRQTIARPDWAALMAEWDAGFLGIDGL